MKDTKLPIAVWLGMLPQPIRDKAIINHFLYPRIHDSDFEVLDPKDCIMLGFYWHMTMEGPEFWLDIYFQIKEQNL